ncbi:MAG: EAL domain-containing protein, partial [Eubacteriales bacterium]|nr:EAL domain-containing protein [Eubacteriales bacterium]
MIQDSKFNEGFIKGQLGRFNIAPETIVFEITEKAAITNIHEFKKIVYNYKGQDYKIAIDDAGAGYSGLNLISDVRPHYLKLDLNLIQGIDGDGVKQALVKGMYEFSKTTGTYLIAEGIETLRELETLINIGVHYAQGYYIQKPKPAIAPIAPAVFQTILGLNAKKNHIYGGNLSEVYIGNLCIGARTVNQNVAIAQACALLKQEGGSQGFCVTREDGAVVGVVTPATLGAATGGLGYTLHGKKSVSAIMNRNFLSIDYRTPVTLAGKLAMSRPDDTLYDFITVTEEGRYLGIVTIKDLLNRAMEIEDMRRYFSRPRNTEYHAEVGLR